MQFSQTITAEAAQCRMNHPRAQGAHPRCTDALLLQAQLGCTLLSPRVISSGTGLPPIVAIQSQRTTTISTAA